MLFSFLIFFSVSTNELKREILATNEVIASYVGTKHVPCMFRTALCPDRCDHARDLAVFNVLNYISYEKVGKYGDDKVSEFLWDTKPSSDLNRLHPEYLNALKNLKEGQKVKICWTHFYIHDDTGSFPERCVTHFEIL